MKKTEVFHFSRLMVHVVRQCGYNISLGICKGGMAAVGYMYLVSNIHMWVPEPLVPEVKFVFGIAISHSNTHPGARSAVRRWCQAALLVVGSRNAEVGVPPAIPRCAESPIPQPLPLVRPICVLHFFRTTYREARVRRPFSQYLGIIPRTVIMHDIR